MNNSIISDFDLVRYTFPRAEHLKSRKVIDQLFHRDKPRTPPAAKPTGEAPLTVYAHPFRVLYFQHDLVSALEPSSAGPGTLLPMPQVLFSVPKRAFKKAVDRNAVRRRVSEAYRLHKHRLIDGPARQIVFLYTAKTKISFDEIEKGMKLALKRMYNVK